jgi:hypothetical protein
VMRVWKQPHGAQLRAAGRVVAMHTPVCCSTVVERHEKRWEAKPVYHLRAVLSTLSTRINVGQEPKPVTSM